MNHPFLRVAATLALGAVLSAAGCSQPAAPPGPTSAPTASVAQPTSAKPSQPSATAAPQPTAVPQKKVEFPAKGKVVTLIVSYPAGGTVDATGRMLAAQMEKEFGTPVQVVNKPGAGSQVGITELVGSKPDGYTFGYTPIPSTITIYLDPERKAVFSRKDLQPIANHVVEPDVITVKADGPYKTLKDLIDAAKAKPDKITVGFTGIMSHQHLAILQLEKATGAKFAVVSFDGSPPALTALLGGHIEVMVADQSIFMPQFKSGDLRILGIMDKEESRYLPGVKTLESQGYPVYMGTTRIISAPSGTPKEIVDILSGTMKKIMATDEHKRKMEEASFTMRYMDPAECEKTWSEMETQIKPLMELAK